ncbi:MAG TPA: uroporphyrinogen-III C-methyltransferase [Terriglobales bacterium]|nr:uroporphyrinogen-III C-methyltransferase [Terriglobales bacterium]
MTGNVYLVGAGPGDPELLTLKALRMLKTAGAVLYDELVSSEILKLVSSTAQLHNVGKRCGNKKITQEEINLLLVTLAASGLEVVRLKSGDPLIFGRAGEEMEALRKAGIECEIVPGVTAALGAAAAVQIPLTHRRQSSALVFLTGHRAADDENADWSKLVSSGATVVIYMPGHRYTDIASRLRRAGLADETPCAIISRATTREQQVHVTTIADLHRAPQFPAPTLLVVGEVVRSAQQEDENFFSLLGAFPAERQAQDKEAIS